MRPTRLSLSVWAAVIAAFALVFSFASPAAASESDDIYSGLNSARASAGAGALAHNASLDAVALAWANQMAANNAMSHNPNTGSQIAAGWSAWGENVAHGFASGTATNAGWTASPGHYANMIGDFTDVGIAFIQLGGTTWAVEVFAKYASSAAAVSTQVVTAAPVTAGPVTAAPGTAAVQTAPAPAAAPVQNAAPATAAAPDSTSTSAVDQPTTRSIDAPALTAAGRSTSQASTGLTSTNAGPVSSASPLTQPIAYVGVLAIALVIGLVVLLVVRARRRSTPTL